LQVLLQERRLAVARDLADAALLVREPEGFRMKPAVGDGVDALRAGPREDLVMAVALACRAGERGGTFEAPRVPDPPRESLENRMRAGRSRAAGRRLFGMWAC
jgi:hypothetical protein